MARLLWVIFLSPLALQTMAAAAPSLIGEHIGSVRGHDTTRAPSTSSMVMGYWNCAIGLRVACVWFFAATAASCRWVVPKVSMCSRVRLA